MTPDVDPVWALRNPAEATQRIRESTGLSQRDFAAHIGVSRSCLRHIEKGRNGASLETMAKILTADCEMRSDAA